MPRPSTTSGSGTSRRKRSRPTRPGPSWGKKDKHGDPSQADDQDLGSQWDHVLLDPESRLVVSLVVGRRSTETALEALLDFYERTDGRLPERITTDEYAPYTSVILDV